jgi:hypothetical protein
MPHVLCIVSGGYGVVIPIGYRVEVIARAIHVGPRIFGIDQFDGTFAVVRYTVKDIGGVGGFHQFLQSAYGIGSVFFVFEELGRRYFTGGGGIQIVAGTAAA